MSQHLSVGSFSSIHLINSSDSPYFSCNAAVTASVKGMPPCLARDSSSTWMGIKTASIEASCCRSCARECCAISIAVLFARNDFPPPGPARMIARLILLRSIVHSSRLLRSGSIGSSYSTACSGSTRWKVDRGSKPRTFSTRLFSF